MIDFGFIADYCIAKPGVEETFPFDETTLVYKVMGKMFALVPTSKDELTMNLKCDPERAEVLREQYEDIIPGFHMNKKHWNTLHIEGALPEKLIFELIDHSYELVVKSLTRKLKDELAQIK